MIMFFILILFIQWALIMSNCIDENEIQVYFDCPDTYYRANHFPVCYKAVFGLFARDDANMQCQNDGGFLATIENSNTKNFLYEMIYIRYKKRFRQTPLNFWIGLNDKAIEGIFEWASCRYGNLRRRSYTNWLRNEYENETIPKNFSRNCVSWVWSRSPGWKTENCSKEHSFLCQVELTFAPNVTVSPASSSNLPTLPKSKINASGSNQNLILLLIGGCLLILLALIIILYFYKRWKLEKRRKALLKKTGIFPMIASVESTLPRIAWARRKAF